MGRTPGGGTSCLVGARRDEGRQPDHCEPLNVVSIQSLQGGSTSTALRFGKKTSGQQAYAATAMSRAAYWYCRRAKGSSHRRLSLG
jgi:hypothetical protein